MKRICLQCKVGFKAAPSAVKASGAKYCSYICRNTGLWAKKEYREHMSEVHKGHVPSGNKNLVAWTKSEKGRKTVSERFKGKMPWIKGRKHSKESIKKMCPFLKGHTPWNKGIFGPKKRTIQAYDAQYRDWMRQVKNRDYWKCQISNDDCSGRVEAHHILPWRDYAELRYEIKNGITLCHFHHPRKRSEEERYAKEFQQLVAAKMQ